MRMNRIGFGTDSLLSLSLSSDMLNSTRRVITFDQASLGLSREYLVSRKIPKEVKNYFEYMVNTAVLLGANETTAR